MNRPLLRPVPADPPRVGRPRSSGGCALLLGAGLLLSQLGLAGCERGFPRGGEEATIEEDRFVAVMAELRSEMNEREGALLPEGERTGILETHGVTEEDLLLFADVHGPDVTYMHQVWIRVDSAVLARAAEMDTPPGGGEGGVLPPTDGGGLELEPVPPGA